MVWKFERCRLFLSSLLAVFPLISYAAQVQLGSTTITGHDVPLFGQEFFGGIPFAEPPIGNLRLKPPVPKLSLSTPNFNASVFGPSCLQPSATAVGLPSSGASSEDCLTINVLRPMGIPAGSAVLPVMAFIHGGGFTAGGSSDYDATAIVAQSVLRGTPVIFVSFNYRLGPLGFPTGIEAAANNALNLGLKDQISALQWVQANIASFGGDKSKVTVFGESAGAVSIGILFLNSGFEKLARAAILESGSADTTFTFEPLRRQGVWNDFAQSIPGCSFVNSFPCIRAASSSALQQAITLSIQEQTEQFPWVPNFDGPNGLYPDFASNLYKKGQFARIPFIAGTNLDEGTVFTPTGVSTDDTIRDWITSNFSTNPIDGALLLVAANIILDNYPDNPTLGSPFNTGNNTFGFNSQYKRLAAIYGDLMFQSTRRLWAQAASNVGVKTYGYLFTGPAPPVVPPSVGVSHGLEILYVYGLLALIPGISPATLKLSSQILHYWVSFATSLDPNDGKGEQRPTWPQYTPTQQTLIELHEDNVHTIADNYRQSQISLLNSNPILFRH